MKALRQTGFAFLLQFGVTVLTLYLFLAVPPLFGCLGYSDRPGPGCYGRPSGITLEQLAEHASAMLEYAAFAALYLWPAAVVCSLVALETRKRPHARWLRALILGVLGFLGTGYLTAGVGWYFALSGLGVLIVALVGGCIAAFIMPRTFTAPERSNQPLQPTAPCTLVPNEKRSREPPRLSGQVV